MQIIKSSYTLENSVNKSRFIGMLMPCLEQSDVADSLRHCQGIHPNASHIAFAYRIKTTNGLVSRSNDAGEPSGTAGKPILQHLEGKDLVNVLLAVIRYFGGIKLGAGGLTRAYGNTARQVIESAKLFPFIDYVETQLTLDYKQMQTLEHVLKKLDGEIIKQDFAEQIRLSVQLPKQNFDAFAAAFEGVRLDQENS